MNQHNLMFLADPIRYINQRAINNVIWFNRAVAKPNDNQRIQLLNILKEGSFDLVGIQNANQVSLVPVGNVLHGDMPIRAYWCPFIQGNVLPGFVDIPRRNPVHNFVFTAAMNGCALVVTGSPLGADQVRVYHHQHPDSQHINQLILQQGQHVTSLITFDDYGEITNPNAFNFLYYRNGGWRFVMQPQTFNMVTLQVAINPNKQTEILDATW